MDVQEAMTLIARPSTAPTPQTWVLSGNLSKEILTKIREAKEVAYGLPKLAKNNLYL
jgi:hypothetical protein